VVSGKRLSDLPPPPRRANLRRAYFDCRYGQLHVRTAFPGGGGFDEGVSAVLLHDAAGSSRDWLEWLSTLGQDRSLYAPDLPGHGESDGPTGAAAATAAVLDLCTELRLRQVLLLARGSGVAVARQVMSAREDLVRGLIECAADDELKAVATRLAAAG
jgi:pimeloyl-ACP methyl ester carboxylesterase